MKPSQDWIPWPKDEAQRYKALGLWRDMSLQAAIFAQARKNPDAPALIDGPRQWSYAQLCNQSIELAQELRAHGICDGRYLVCHLGNQAEFFLLLMACWIAGATPIMAIASHRKREIDAYIEQSQAAAYVGTDPDFASRLAGDAVRLVLKKSETQSLELQTVNGASAIRIGIPSQKLHESALQAASPAGTTLAMLQLSGGSTGTPKLIPRTHNDYLYSIEGSIQCCNISASTRYFAVLPLSHNFCLSSPGTLGVLICGGCVIIGASAQASVAFEQIETHQANASAVVPSIARMWTSYAQQSERALESLEQIWIGGGPLDPQSAGDTEETLGVRVHQVYGMAEGLVCYTPADAAPIIRWRCQGSPLSPYDELKIVDEHGVPCLQGEEGELWTKGPYTIRGYFRNPDHNEVAFSPDGFYKTGDLVRQRQDGHLEVTGRVKQQINRGGEKIASVEVEGLLRQHPKVLDVAVVGLPDPTLGEKSCAVLVWQGQEDLRTITLLLRRFMRSQDSALFKIPDLFLRTQAIPLSRIGKVDRGQLRESLIQGASI